MRASKCPEIATRLGRGPRHQLESAASCQEIATVAFSIYFRDFIGLSTLDDKVALSTMKTIESLRSDLNIVLIATRFSRLTNCY